MAATLKSDDHGGRLDAMERRVQILEDDMREVKADLKAVLIDTAEIKGTLKGMPTATALGDLAARMGELKGSPSAAAFAELSAKVGELKGMPTAAAFADLSARVAELKGRVDPLPTMAKMNSALGIATAVIVILNNWPVLKAWLIH